MGATLTYMYYIAGLFLAALPIIIEFFTRKNGTPKKPTWYIWSIIITIVFLLSVGGYKVHSDNKEKRTNDSTKLANEKTVSKLSANVDSIKIFLSAVKDSDKRFEDTLFTVFNIKRNYKTNQPIFIGKIDNSHTNYIHMKHASHFVIQ